MVSRRLRVAVPALVAVLGASLCFVAPAGAADPANATVAGKGVDWLVTRQQSDGGFEVAGFPGFETPDAVLAVAQAAQTGSTWSTTEALAAVQAVKTGGKTALDALDDFVDGGISAGQAAKLILLVVKPLGLDPTDFDPSDDTGPAVNLATTVDPQGCAGNPATFGFFNQTLYGALAKKLLCGVPNAAALATIRAAQRADGGWNFNGSLAAVDPSDPFDPNAPDIDTTALALQALVAGAAAWNDPAVTAGLAYLAAQQTASGAFESFGSDDPNSTAVAILAISAAGFDVTSSCWRDTAVPALSAKPYVEPSAWLRSGQQSDGHIASPNDGPTPNTFATSQTVEGLLRRWLPVAVAPGATTCVVPGGEVVAAPDPVDLVPRFTG